MLFPVLLLVALGDFSAATQCQVAKQMANGCKNVESGVVYESSLNAICMKGEISEDTRSQFFGLMDFLYSGSSGKSPANYPAIVISSPGGFVSPAMDIGDYVTSKGMDVIINDICLSACSQFVFLAGKNKIFLEGAIPAFHGGAIPRSRIEEMDISRSNKDRLIGENERFYKFYSDRGLDIKMLTQPPKSVGDEINAGNVVFWALSPTDLKGYDVTGIIDCKESGE